MRRSAPARALRRARRQLDLARFARHASTEPCDGLVRLGTEYGGYVLPEQLPHRDWICYSGGIGEDASFELELIARFGCEVIGFDPTPRSIEYMQTVVVETPRFRFFPVGLWASDTEQRFDAPDNPQHVSHSITDQHSSDEFFVAQCRSVPSLMTELGHEAIDLLKLDIEGAEYAVLASVLDANVRAKILVVEFHRVGPLNHTTAMIDRIRSEGYRLVHRDGMDVTFVETALV